MAGEKKTLLENIISLGALQIVSYIIPLVNLPYLSRVLGVENFGLVFFAFAFMQYFMILTDFGFWFSATREIAVNRHNKNNISNIFNSVNCAKFILLIVSFVVLLLCLIFVPKLRENSPVFILSFLMVVGNAIYPVWFFQGMERMKYITFLNILSKMIFLILIFIFVKQDSDYIIVPLLNSLGFIISGIIGFVFAVKNFDLKLYVPSFKSIIQQLKKSSEFFLSRVSVSLYTNTNTFCLGLIGSNLMVGYYVAAEKIYQALNSIQGPISTALYPFVAKNKDVRLYKKILKIANICNVFICIFVFIFAKEVITIFYGSQMILAYKILRIFCGVVLVSFMSGMVGYPLIAALGYTREANGSIIIGSIFHIVGLFALFLLDKLNVYSIALLVFITESIVLSIRIYFICKYKLLKIKEIKL